MGGAWRRGWAAGSTYFATRFGFAMVGLGIGMVLYGLGLIGPERDGIAVWEILAGLAVAGLAGALGMWGARRREVD